MAVLLYKSSYFVLLLVILIFYGNWLVFKYKKDFVDMYGPFSISASSLLDIKSYYSPKKEAHLSLKCGNIEIYKLEEERSQKFKCISPHNFELVITPRVNCQDSEILLCVLTSRTDFQIRQTIRKTWGSYANNTDNKATLMFFLGSEVPAVNFYESSQPMIVKEAEIFGYILQENYIDIYANLTHKSVSILKWISIKCPKSKYILKSDNDMYVNVPLLVQTLRQVSANKKNESLFVLGHAKRNTKPLRNKNSKWYASETQFPNEFYPDYATGPAYAMTAEAAKSIYLTSLQQPFFWLEDVYITGVLRTIANISLVDSPLILSGKREPSGCFFRTKIAGERLSSMEIYKIHRELTNITNVC